MKHAAQIYLQRNDFRPKEKLVARASGHFDIASSGRLGFSVYHNFDSVEAIWRRLEQDADCTVFQSFDWLATWHKRIGSRQGVLPAIVVGRFRSGEPAFILPLGIYRDGLVSRLSFLGGDVCDYNGPLLASDFDRLIGVEFVAVWKQICSLVREHDAYRYDFVVLDKMPERIGQQPNPFLKLDVTLNASSAYLARLGRSWEDFYAGKRSSATRRRDRAKRKRLAEAGEPHLLTVRGPEASGTLSKLITMKQRSLARMGASDFLSRPGRREFYLDLATNPKLEDVVHVSRFELGDNLAAANFGLVFRGHYHYVLASYEDGPWARFGPGAAHLHDLIQYAIERGCSAFDFTIGDEPYKLDWFDDRLTLYDHVAGATVLGAVAAKVNYGARRLRRAIKQSDLLWPAALRLRTGVASAKAWLSSPVLKPKSAE